MNEVVKYSLIMLISVFCSSCSQIILKKAAAKEYKNRLAEYLNIRVITAYAIFFLSFGLTMLSLRHIPLSLAPILESSGYVFVAILSFFFLNECLGKKQLCAIALIILGITIFAL